MNDVDFIVGELAKLRKEKGLTIDDLAADAEVSLNKLWQWEHKKQFPSLPNLVKWADALGYHFDLHPNEGNRR